VCRVSEMDKTKVDDMLIEMITPKVKEIEENFSQRRNHLN
jgi:hypothetical protein